MMKNDLRVNEEQQIVDDFEKGIFIQIYKFKL